MELNELIREIHIGCFKLCHEAIGRYLPIAGNIGIFCQSEEDLENYTKAKEELTYPSENPDQKYFTLKTPIFIPETDGIPSATYTYLYIRKPNIDSPELGDVDFVLPKNEYEELKAKVINGENIEGASIYDRPGWDTIEIRNPDIRALAYISTQEMAEKVRVRF